jgi:hypothetical protein
MFIEPVAVLLLVTILLTAAWHHGVHAPAFRKLLTAQDLWPTNYVTLLAFVVPLAEIAIAVLLVVETAGLIAAPIGSILSVTLFSLYSLYLLILLWYRPSVPCACSSIEEAVTPVHIWRSSALTVLSLACVGVDGAAFGGLDALQIGIVLAAGVAGATIAWILPSAVADPWAASR